MILAPDVGRLVVLISTVTLMLLVSEVIVGRIKARRSYLWIAALTAAVLFQAAAISLTVVDLARPYLPAHVAEQIPW